MEKCSDPRHELHDLLFENKDGVSMININKDGSADDEIQKVCDYVEDSSKITDVLIKGKKISGQSLALITDKLINPDALETIVIDGLSDIPDSIFSRFITKIAVSEKLGLFNLYMGGISRKFTEDVCNSIKGRESMEGFAFGGEGLGGEGLQILLDAAPSFPRLKALFLITEVEKDRLGDIVAALLRSTSAPEIEIWRVGAEDRLLYEAGEEQ